MPDAVLKYAIFDFLLNLCPGKGGSLVAGLPALFLLGGRPAIVAVCGFTGGTGAIAILPVFIFG